MVTPSEPIRAPELPPAADLRDAWSVLSVEERVEAFSALTPLDAQEFFTELTARAQGELILALPPTGRRLWMRFLEPDDAADVVQEAPPEPRAELLALLDEPTRKEVTGLLAYAEDDAGGLMNPRFARLRPDMGVDEAFTYLRRQAREKLETINYAYVLDNQQKLLGTVSFRDLFVAKPGSLVRDAMETDLVTVPEQMDQEAVGRLFQTYDLLALPVVDSEGRMKGVVTVDDIVDVVQEEATEDIQKIGGTEALDAPYLEVGTFSMVRKRAGWLIVLFLGEMLTATAMAQYEDDIKAAVVLAVFIPLIISSGGNSGSQATTLVIRAMALGEVKLRNWRRVFVRELVAGALLGLVLGGIGFLRIFLWPWRERDYGEHFTRIGATVAVSLLGVVLWGTLTGSMLPLLLRRLGFDPASASAPFVATLVDVTGLVIYFTVASALLGGLLL
jgi:magnesium transporter